MFKTFIIHITIWSFYSIINAQNLVPNSSFEDAIPDSTINLDFKNNFTCKIWNSPTKGTPDYYTSSRTGDFGCPLNRYGFLMAHSGAAYCGFVTKYNGNSYEYLQIKLNSKLIKDSIYCISFYVSIPKYAAFSTNEVNCFLSNEKNEFNLNHEIINNSSYIKLLTKESYIKPNIWNQVINYYIAKGGEEYLVIGMLNKNYNNFKISTTSSNNVQKGIYMFIDDVSLKAISDSSECKLEEIPISYKEAIEKPLILKNLNFETNKAILKSTSNPELSKLAQYLKQNPDYKIEITGYTDNIGDEDNNITLSYARAKSVAEYLIKESISKKRIKYNGMGSKHPIKPNDTEENRLINRRVEIKLTR